jgi:secreted trypsin-like serine protease
LCRKEKVSKCRKVLKPILVIFVFLFIIGVIICLLCLFDFYIVKTKIDEELNSNASLLEEIFMSTRINQNVEKSLYSNESDFETQSSPFISTSNENFKWNHCGETYVKPSINPNSLIRKMVKRIVGGEDAVEHSWPFLVSVRIKVNKSEHHCGGTLITDEYILTAAHCLFAYLKIAFDFNLTSTSMLELIEVHVGINEHQTEHLAKENIYGVEYFDFHDKFYFDDWKLKNDIAIMKLKSKVNISRPEVNVACVPRSNDNEHKLLIGEKVVAIGWGTYAEEYNYTAYVWNQLQQAVFTIKDPDDELCNKGEIGNEWDKNYTICAHGEEKKMVTCFGDSGGPVLAYDNNRWILVGIISFAHDVKDFKTKRKKCDASMPFYFVKVRAYFDWILKKTNYTLAEFTN